MSYQELYNMAEVIIDQPENYQSADAYAALAHLKALAELPLALPRRKTVDLY